MDKNVIANLLDDAIATAGRTEFDQLSNGMSSSDIAANVEGALGALADLSRGNPPDYGNQWVALFYLLWYQPKQINLAYNLIEGMLLERRHGQKLVLNNQERLHIIDFGCGTLAFQFALGLSLAKAIDLNESVPEIRVHSIDSSESMIELGKSCWDSFKSRISGIEGCENLSQAFNSVIPSYHVNIDTIAARELSADYWLSAIHAVYPVNKEQVQGRLAFLYEHYSPTVGFITSHSRNSYLVDSISPVEVPRYQMSQWVSGELLGDALPITTQMRKDVLTSIRNRLSPVRGNLGIIDPFLRKSVTWQWRFAACRTYTKQW